MLRDSTSGFSMVLNRARATLKRILEPSRRNESDARDRLWGQAAGVETEEPLRREEDDVALQGVHAPRHPGKLPVDERHQHALLHVAPVQVVREAPAVHEVFDGAHKYPEHPLLGARVQACQSRRR